jgi:hypothetical protein
MERNAMIHHFYRYRLYSAHFQRLLKENRKHIFDNPFTAFTFEEVLKKLFFCKSREMRQVVTFKTEVTSKVLN